MCRRSANSRNLSPSELSEGFPGSGPSAHWTEREVDEAAFKDARLGRRCAELVKKIGEAMGESIPYACQDWANAKAAYRFLSNARVDESDILSGHFAATRARCDAFDGPILLIQDTRHKFHAHCRPQLAA